MKKLLYIFIGIGIALGCVVLYSFKAKQTSEVSYALVSYDGGVFICYSDGVVEAASKVLNLDKKLYEEVVIAKTLQYLHLNGYKLVTQSTTFRGGGEAHYTYTLIKQN